MEPCSESVHKGPDTRKDGQATEERKRARVRGERLRAYEAEAAEWIVNNAPK